MWASADWVIAGREVPETCQTKGVLRHVGSQDRIVVGGVVSGLVKVMAGRRGA